MRIFIIIIIVIKKFVYCIFFINMLFNIGFIIFFKLKVILDNILFVGSKCFGNKLVINLSFKEKYDLIIIFVKSM